MKELIEALQIFYKYNKNADVSCEHDVLYVCGVSVDDVSDEDVERLAQIGFSFDEGISSWSIFV